MLLLDEPFSALDQPLRIRMRKELARILETFDIPMIMVTHDSDEVASFAETIVVYHNGSVANIHAADDFTNSSQSLAEALHNQVAMAYE